MHFLKRFQQFIGIFLLQFMFTKSKKITFYRMSSTTITREKNTRFSPFIVNQKCMRNPLTVEMIRF